MPAGYEHLNGKRVQAKKPKKIQRDRGGPWPLRERQLMSKGEQLTGKQIAWSWIKDILIAVIIAVVIIQFIKPTIVKESSMEPNFYANDYLFVYKMAYKSRLPAKGDVVIFQSDLTYNGKKKLLIKRVIGLPGEKVTIEDAKIYINDSETPLKEDYLKETWTEATGPFEFEVPKDSYLVLGDNRNDSYDARYWDHTYVSKDKIIGKAYFIYYPFQRLGSLYK
jgi:signal peptidase I